MCHFSEGNGTVYMKHINVQPRHPIGEFIRFAAVGVLNTGVDMTIFFLFTWLGVAYIGAQIISYSCGTANSYLLNKLWTFRSSGLSFTEMVRFIIVNGASLGISLVCLALLHDRAGIGLGAAKVAATIAALGVNFLGNKLWVFNVKGN
ncbi:MAG: GtrA family protein [Desulfuromonadaceae bacterium]|nr:GtrA family protein [Desulfuromonadaceae bacterium]